MIKLSYNGLTIHCIRGIFDTIISHFQGIKVSQYLTGRFRLTEDGNYCLELEILKTDSGEMEKEIISTINEGFMKYL